MLSTVSKWRKENGDYVIMRSNAGAKVGLGGIDLAAIPPQVIG